MPRKRRTKSPGPGNVEQEPASPASITPTPPPSKGSRSKDAKNKSPFSSGNKRSKTTERVPTGLYHWLGEGDVTHPVHLVMDQHGEFFLIQKNTRKGKGKVYWSHKTNLDMYSLMVSDGVTDYVDAGVTMCPYIHRRGKEPKVISHKRTSLETLQKKLKHKLRRTYREDQIDAKSELVELNLNYETGEKCDKSSPGCFSISITRYHISLWSSAEPRVLQSDLVFADVEALFPDEKFSDKKVKIGEKDFACEVFYARNLDEFRKICSDYDIERLPGGRSIDDLLWMQEYRTKMILVDEGAEWTNNETNGLYEGENARVIRMEKTDTIMNKIKKLRWYDDNDNILHFYGWQEEADHFYLAFETCEDTLEDFLSRDNNFTTISSKESPLRLDILRGIAKGVLSLQRKGRYHGNLKPANIFIKDNTIAKLGPCSFIFEDGDDDHNSGSVNDNIQDLAKIILHCTSGGIYKVSDQELQAADLNHCKMVEARDLIERILDKSISSVTALLAHYLFWGAIKRLSFMGDFSEHIHNQHNNAWIVRRVTSICLNNRVYDTPSWDTKMSKTTLFYEMEQHRLKEDLPPYEYKEPRSLVRFIRNAFNHHGSFTDYVYKEIGYSKLV